MQSEYWDTGKYSCVISHLYFPISDDDRLSIYNAAGHELAEEIRNKVP